MGNELNEQTCDDNTTNVRPLSDRFKRFNRISVLSIENQQSQFAFEFASELDDHSIEKSFMHPENL